MIGILFAFSLPFLLVFIYRYYEKERQHWSVRGVPGPPPKWFLGNLLDLIDYRKPRSIVLKDWTKKYGKVYGIHEGQRKMLVVADFAMLEDILTKKFDFFHERAREDGGPKEHIAEARGLHWKRLRALGSSAFSNSSLKQVYPEVENSAKIMLAELKKAGINKPEVNMLDYFQEYTMDIICKLALGKKDVVMFSNPYLDITKEVFLKAGNDFMFQIPNLFPSVNAAWVRMLDYIGTAINSPFLTLRSNIGTEIEKRKLERETGKSRGKDFIDIFLDAEVDESEIAFNEEDKKEGFLRQLAFEEIVSQCHIFLLAGFETSSSGLAYTAHFLANYPEVQEKMYEEIEAVFPDEQQISYEQLNELQYTECVIKETLRHYPLANFIVNRECMESTLVGDFYIEKGTAIATDTWSMHMDKAVWGEDAELFRPERWLEESSRPRAAFQAFGEGPRMCLGMRLAYIEMKVILALLLKQFRVVKSDHTNPIILVGSFTVAPENVMVKIEKRTI